MTFSKIVIASLARAEKGDKQKVFWKAHKLHFKLDEGDMGQKGVKSGAFKTTNVCAQFMCFSSGIVFLKVVLFTCLYSRNSCPS
jgi:hypothetical protein